MIDLRIARRAAEACVLSHEVEGATIHPRNMVLMMADEIENLRLNVAQVTQGLNAGTLSAYQAADRLGALLSPIRDNEQVQE